MKNCLLFAGLWCLLLTNGLLAQTPEPKPVAKPAAKAKPVRALAARNMRILDCNVLADDWK